MARVACTVMLKNEHALVGAFLRYHANLFGAENLFVFDNGTTDQETLETLARFEAEGVNVDRSFPAKQDYTQKGKIVGNLVKRLDRDADYDFYILLDCDEFVAMKVQNEYTCIPEKIHRYLDSLKGEKKILTVNLSLSNIIGKLYQFQAAAYLKTIFPRNVLVETDHGHHAGTSRTGAGSAPCDIVYVHYHYRPYDEVVRYARQKLSTIIPSEVLDDVDRLRSYKGQGWHMVDYLVGGAEAYYEQFRNVWNPIIFSELGAKFAELEIEAPFGAFALPPISGTSRRRTPVHVVLDEASGQIVKGWAMDMARPEIPVQLKFLIDGVVVYDSACDGSRLDVLANGLKSGQVGFSFVPPDSVSDGRRHFLTMQDAGGSPMTMLVEQIERCEVDILATGPASVASLASIGNVDGVYHGRVHGWVLRSIDTPEGRRLLGRTTVALQYEGHIVTQMTADMERLDVAGSLKGEAECGFALQVPSALLDVEEEKTFRIFLMPEMRELEGSPCVMARSLAVTGPQGAI